MRLTRIAKPFDDPDYVFELKHDGFRAIAYIEAGECKLVSRNLKHFKSFGLSGDCIYRVRTASRD
jgi:bifunctional non-homologous end joining protein LigD